jgi:hypothetical protein
MHWLRKTLFEPMFALKFRRLVLIAAHVDEATAADESGATLTEDGFSGSPAWIEIGFDEIPFCTTCSTGI